MNGHATRLLRFAAGAAAFCRRRGTGRERRLDAGRAAAEGLGDEPQHHQGIAVLDRRPGQLPPTGLVWRIARPLKGGVVRQVGEGDVSGATVLVFSVVGKGKASIVLALTKGDTSPKAVAAVRYAVTAT